MFRAASILNVRARLLLRQRLIGLVIGLLLAGGVATVLVQRSLEAAGSTLSEIVDTLEPISAAAYDLEVASSDYGLEVVKYLTEGKGRERDGIHRSSVAFRSARMHYEEQVVSDGRPDGADRLAELSRELESLADALIDQPPGRATRTEFGEFLDVRSRLTELLAQRIRQPMRQRLAEAKQRAHRMQRRARLTAQVSIWLPVTIAVVFAIGFGRRIIRRISLLNEGTSALARGNLRQRIPSLGGDELGVLAERINRTADNLRGLTASKAEMERTHAALRQANADLCREIDDRQKAERELTRRHTHDRLTQLPNLGLYRDRLAQMVRAAQRRNEACAVVILDLNRFKDVNASFGQLIGDQVLQLLTERLLAVLRDSDTLARVGGNEFAVLLPATDGAGAEGVVAKLQSALHKPFAVKDQTVYLRGSVGVAVFPEDGEPDTLHQNAEIAMFTAKRSGRDHERFAANEQDRQQGRLGLVSDLRSALRRGGLELYYQPKLDLHTGRIDSVEVLLRWHHPRRGLVLPDEFIPLAERENDLITALTVWTLHNALVQCRRWHDAGWKIGVSVNCSVKILSRPEFPALVKDLLESSGVAGEHLIIEVTESVLMARPEQTLPVIRELIELGVSVDIDDFGTGYSSLAYLKLMPVNAVKIDKTFVLDMLHDANDTAIVKLIIDLARSLDIQVVAEGVENQRTLEQLTDLGCDVAQGFHIGRPVPANDLTPNQPVRCFKRPRRWVSPTISTLESSP